MAITARELEVAMDSADTKHKYIVSRHIPTAAASTDHWYISAVVGPNKGKSCWVATTAADNAATQAAAAVVTMTTAGPIGI